jgi:hypothetical protein
LPPPATPWEYTGAGAGWAASGRLSMRVTGPACWKDPVVSGPLRGGSGLSLNRVDSPLQPPIPTLTSTTATARGQIGERSRWTIGNIDTPARNTGVELKPAAVNKELSKYEFSTLLLSYHSPTVRALGREAAAQSARQSEPPSQARLFLL